MAQVRTIGLKDFIQRLHRFLRFAALTCQAILDRKFAPEPPHLKAPMLSHDAIRFPSNCEILHLDVPFAQEFLKGFKRMLLESFRVTNNGHHDDIMGAIIFATDLSRLSPTLSLQASNAPRDANGQQSRKGHYKRKHQRSKDLNGCKFTFQ